MGLAALGGLDGCVFVAGQGRAAAQHLPCMVVVNKIDADPDHLSELLDALTEAFGRGCLPLDLPAGHAEKVVDVVSQNEGESDISSPVAAHTALVEQLVEVDEAAMEQYLEQGDVDPAALHAPFAQALREAKRVVTGACA